MTKRTLFILSISVLFLAFLGCHHDSKPLSAGETAKPNVGYSVTKKSDDGYEPVHNTKLKNPYEKLKPHLTPNVPNHLKPHSRLVMTDVEDRTFFDFFAWQTFVGLVWPADPQLRGTPNRTITPEEFSKYNSNDASNPNRVPVVWETFRTFDEAFPVTKKNPNSGPPEEWDTTPYKRPFVLDLTSKGNSHDNLNEAFSSVLIDQNRQYVRYSLGLNKVMYEFIRQNKWYLKENLPKSPTPATLPPLVDPATQQVTTISQPQTNTVIKQTVNGNSIEIKSAWRIMILKEDIEPNQTWKKADDLSRYFVSKANVTDAVTGEVKEVLVGLVGLHVVVKTPQFVQGLWSSFEHVDNVKAPKGIRPSFHDETDTVYEEGFSYNPGRTIQKEEDRVPVEVSRTYKIPETPVGTGIHLPDGLSTVALNTAFQRLLKGTVWENYQLVITQWPTDPTTFYPKPDLFPRSTYPSGDPKKDSLALPAVKEAYARAVLNAKNAYPRWSGLPLPQIGALNTTMETYFQNPNPPTKGPNKGIRQAMENTSCMGCHYGASDTDYSWGLKLRTYPQPFNQGRVSLNDSTLVDYIKSNK
ncbi:MAG: hypothetical protein JXR05_10380 [Flavobacteriaceae bacterium]